MSAMRNQMKCRHAPGVWEDMEGGIHFSVPELLAAFDLEDNPDNRRECEQMLSEIVCELAPHATVIYRPKPN